jgi:hypothetical protein
MVQSRSVNDPQDRDAVSLVPEWPRAVEAPSGGFKNDGLVSGRPSIVSRMFRTIARFSIAGSDRCLRYACVAVSR